MINYEVEYNKANKKIGELGEKIANKDQMLRQLAAESVEKDGVIADLQSTDHRTCWGWKVICAILSVYILITTLA